MNTYIEKVFKGNPWLNEIRDDFVFSNVYSDKESTKSIPIGNGKSLIVLDSHIQKFLWMMNKSHLYGGSNLTGEENIQLYVEIFLHFSSIIISNSKKAFPKPKTPSHNTKEEFYILALYTEIQEIYLICHEIGHALIREKKYEDRFDTVSPKRSRHIEEFLNLSDSLELIDEEIMADEIAFEMTLNVYGRNNPEVVELISTAIFLVIRYFIWLRVVYKTSEEDFEFGMWLSRNSFIRQKVGTVYHWSSPEFIIMLIDYLEDRMEPAALIAKEIIDKVRASGEL
ncbi:hypothetical protein ACSFV5_17085 [Acinetobacter sp. HC8-3S]